VTGTCAPVRDRVRSGGVDRGPVGGGGIAGYWKRSIVCVKRWAARCISLNLFGWAMLVGPSSKIF
jgi:hypothetical protein